MVSSKLSYKALLACYEKEKLRNLLLTKESTVQQQVIELLKQLMSSNQTKPYCVKSYVISDMKIA